MKRTLPLLCCLFSLTLFTACRKEKDKDKPSPQLPASGVVRPQGAIIAPPLEKQVGPEGGTVTSADGYLTVTIPAGALDAATTIGIQRIENTNTGGIGSGYRLSPGNITFKKPVSIACSYEPVELLVQHITTIGMAFQDDKGIWQFVPQHVINTGLKTVTVQSTRMGDWSLMTWMFINPYFADLNVNDSQTFEALRVLPLAIQNGLLKPKAQGATIPVEAATALETQFIKKWELTGAGVLTTNGAKATYKAPANVPPDFDVVTLHLQQESVTMVSKVRVNGSMVQYRVDDGEWQIKSVELKKREDGMAEITSTGGKSFELTFNDHLGERPFTHTEQFKILDATGEFTYRSIYTIVWEGRDSPGNINITSLENEAGYLTGTFTATSSGKYPVAGGFNKSVHKVEGKFKVKHP